MEVVGKPLGASRQLVHAWKSRRARPSRLMRLLARYVWTFGPLRTNGQLLRRPKLSGGMGRTDGLDAFAPKMGPEKIK